MIFARYNRLREAATQLRSTAFELEDAALHSINLDWLCMELAKKGFSCRGESGVVWGNGKYVFQIPDSLETPEDCIALDCAIKILARNGDLPD